MCRLLLDAVTRLPIARIVSVTSERIVLEVTQRDAEQRVYVIQIDARVDGAKAKAKLVANPHSADGDITADTSWGETLISASGHLHLTGTRETERLQDTELDLVEVLSLAREWCVHFSNYMDTGVFLPLDIWAKPWVTSDRLPTNTEVAQ